MIDKSKYLDMFVEEAQEHLQILNSVLLDLGVGFDPGTRRDGRSHLEGGGTGQSDP